MAPSDILIRPAIPDDLAALHALIEGAYRGDSARQGWTHEADLLGGQRIDLEELAALLTVPDEAMLVMTSRDALIGCVHLLRTTTPGLVYLGKLAISPTLQAGGLGKRLLDAAQDHATAVMGAQRIEMTVIDKRPELIAWYERRGYVRTGEEWPFPLDDERFGQPRRRDLAFVVLEKPVGDTNS